MTSLQLHGNTHNFMNRTSITKMKSYTGAGHISAENSETRAGSEYGTSEKKSLRTGLAYRAMPLPCLAA